MSLEKDQKEKRLGAADALLEALLESKRGRLFVCLFAWM
jgi:hypothetical protein